MGVRGRVAVVLICCFFGGMGCVTHDPSVIGSRAWYDQRIEEIEAAYASGDLATEDYLRLKNEADRIRVDYRRGIRGGSVSLGVGYHHHR